MNDPRRSRTALLTGLAGFIVVQLILTSLLAGKLSWLRSPNYGHKVDRLHKAIAGSTLPRTVVMLGSSRTVYGLKGSAIATPEQPVVVYNFGLHAAGPVSYLLHLRRLLADGIRPDLLLIEVLPPVLSKHGPFNDTSASYLPTASLRLDELPLVGRYAQHRAVVAEDWWLSWCVPCYHHRIALVSHSLPTLLSLDDRLDGMRRTDDNGWMPVHKVLRAPEKRRAALEWARQDYTARLANFDLGGPNVEALEETLRLCRREQIRTALVLMPEGPAFQSWYPRRVLDQVNGLLARLSRRHAVPVVDARKWLDTEDVFLDSHHLLPEGAETFSRRLAVEALLLLPPRTLPDERSNEQLARQPCGIMR